MNKKEYYKEKGDIVGFKYGKGSLKSIFDNSVAVTFVCTPDLFYQIAYELGKNNVHVTKDAWMEIAKIIQDYE